MRRLVDDWALLLSVFVGVLVASTLVAGAPVYLGALDRLALGNELDKELGKYLNLNVFSRTVRLSEAGLEENERVLDEALASNLGDLDGPRERFLKTNTYLAGLPSSPLPRQGARSGPLPLGYFQSLTNLERNSRFIQGVMATDATAQQPAGPVVEAVVSEPTASEFGLKVDDAVTLAPSTAHPTRITAIISGIIEPDDPKNEFWRYPSIFLDPQPPQERRPGVAIRQQPPLALFVTRRTLTEVVNEAYPGTLVDPFWFALVETQGLSEWPVEELRRRIDSFEQDISRAMPGSGVLTGGIKGILDDLSRRSLFSRVPLLLLLTVMVATVLFYLSMTVSYLVQKREGDLALLKTRGLGALQLLRLYGLEAAVLTVLAVVIAPFLALAAVALAGRLPYFSQSTAGHNLPIQFTPQPFLAALGAGALCLAILLVPALVGARRSLAVHKLSSSRPPSVPFFQRYYLDVALLVLGGLVFWELHARGQFVSGGLFKQVQVNETLLLAPVIFLFVVALVFVRLFPLLVRFVSGESPALAHLFTAATLLAIVPLAAFHHFDDGGLRQAAAPTALLLAVGLLYWAATQLRRFRARIAAIALQAAAVAAFIYLYRPSSDDVMFLPAVGLVAIVPVQIAFMALRTAARTAPVWLSMGLWRMARNPLQYTWLVVLLLLATGLAILSTTVGGTLDQSQIDRIHYDVAADVRVSGITKAVRGGAVAIRDASLETGDVASAALAYRGEAFFGPVRAEILGLESREFERVTWYRDDFSARPLNQVVAALNSHVGVQPLAVPAGASGLGVWAKPAQRYGDLFLWIALEDGSGNLRHVSLGELGDPEWQLMHAGIPEGLKRPVRLVALQVFEPAGSLGRVGRLASQFKGTPGTVLLDDVHATFGGEGGERILDDFEGPIEWTPIITAATRYDEITPTAEAFQGQTAAAFSFGGDRNRFLRGVYRSPAGGTVPVVASTSFLEVAGLNLGDVFIGEIEGRQALLMIEDEVDYFPTVSPEGTGFILADLSQLMYHINLVSETNPIAANELYIASRPGAERKVSMAMRELAAGLGSVQDRASLLQEANEDPLAGVGSRTLVLISSAVVVLAAGLGYLTYLLSSARRSQTEAGFLQAIGLSRRQLLSWIGIENIGVSALGLIVGSWVGLEMSRIVISAVTTAQEGHQVLPPAVITIDWPLLLMVLAALVSVLLLALFIVNRTMLRLDLQAISRLGE